jgi:RND family efflux transporter MFP subunit
MMKNHRVWLGLGLFAIVLPQLPMTAQSPLGRPASGVESFTEPYRTVRVAAPEQGIVEQVLAREGSRVAAGQPLVRLDTALHEAQLKIARAGVEEKGRVEAAQADVAYQWQRVEKLRSLRESGSAQQAELDRGVADLATAEAQLRIAQEAVTQKVLEHQKILVQIERRTIRSPIAGVVTEVFKEPGEFTAANDPSLVTVVQLDPLVATFRISQEAAASLEPGMQLDVELANGSVHASQIEFVSPLIDASVGTVEVKVRIPNTDGRLPGGMRCWLRQ